VLFGLTRCPHQRPGRGRTFSALRESGLKGFVVRTLTLFCFANAMLGGLTRRAAWLSETVSAAWRSSGGLDCRRHDFATTPLTLGLG
jgi:hypothetical protein